MSETKYTLEPLAPGLFELRHDLHNGGVHFPGRMTVIQSQQGLTLFSPVPIDDAAAAALAQLGPVKWIVAPNSFHHLHLKAATQRYPDAFLLGNPALARKRKDLRFSGLLPDACPEAWGDDVEVIAVEGLPKITEVVLFHRPTGTLITADLLFNIRKVDGWLSRMVFRMAGALGRPAQSRMLRFFTKDRAAAARSVARILALPIERVVMAHGEVLETNARAQLTEALHWMRAGAPLTPLQAA